MNIRLDMVGATNFCVGQKDLSQLDKVRKLAKDEPLGELYTKEDLIECHYVNNKSKLWVDHKEFNYQDIKPYIEISDEIIGPVIESGEDFLIYIMWIKDKETFAQFDIEDFQLDKLKIIVSLKDNILIDIKYKGESIEYETDYIESWVDRVEIYYMKDGKTITETIT